MVDPLVECWVVTTAEKLAALTADWLVLQMAATKAVCLAVVTAEQMVGCLAVS